MATAVPKAARPQTDQLEAALQSIADRWNGDFASFLADLARAKELEATKQSDVIFEAGPLSRALRKR